MVLFHWSSAHNQISVQRGKKQKQIKTKPQTQQNFISFLIWFSQGQYFTFCSTTHTSTLWQYKWNNKIKWARVSAQHKPGLSLTNIIKQKICLTRFYPVFFLIFIYKTVDHKGKKKHFTEPSSLSLKKTISKTVNIFKSKLFLPHGNKHIAHMYEELSAKRTKFSTQYQKSNMKPLNIFYSNCFCNQFSPVNTGKPYYLITLLL